MPEQKSSRWIFFLQQQWHCLLCGIRFLTIVPVGSAAAEEQEPFSGALFCFTLIGALIGGVVALVALTLQLFFPALVVAAVVSVLLSLASGFLHLDGLADTADGFLSGRPRDGCLAIMRDSRIGTMGAAAVAGLFLIKTAALSAIGPAALAAGLIIAAAAGRTAIVLSMAMLSYARPGGGLGELFYSKSTRKAAAVSMLMLLVLLAVLAPQRLLIVMAALIFCTAALGWACRRKLGGATGDTLGAVCELCEAAVLVAFTFTVHG